MACNFIGKLSYTGTNCNDACSIPSGSDYYSTDTALTINGDLYTDSGCSIIAPTGFYSDIPNGGTSCFEVVSGIIKFSGTCSATTVQFRDCENGENVFRFYGNIIPTIVGNIYYVDGFGEYTGCATIIANDGSGPLYDANSVTFTLVDDCGNVICPRTSSAAATLSKCSDGTLYYFNVDLDTAFIGAAYIYNSECYAFVEFSGPGGTNLGSPLFDSCDYCVPTPTPTRTPNPTPTNTPTPSPTPLPCPNSSYCFSTTFSSLSGYNGTYSSTTLSYNSKIYYTGGTDLVGYLFFDVSNKWCLSDGLGNPCVLEGKSPCYSDCPDLASNTFAVGDCPPAPTPPVNCDLLDFYAYFDCEYVPPVTPTPAIDCGDVEFNITNFGVTPTPSNSPVYIVGVDFSIAKTSSTPTPSVTATPTMTPNKTQISGKATFVVLDPPFNCPGVKVLISCEPPYNQYYVNNNLAYGNTFVSVGTYMYAQISSGSTTSSFCVKYDRDDANLSSNSNVNQVYQVYPDCNSCLGVPTPTPTPTHTSTPTPSSVTPTPTPTNTTTNTETPTQTPTNTTTNTETPTQTPTQTPTMTQTPSLTPYADCDLSGYTFGGYVPPTPPPTPSSTATQTPTPTQTPTNTETPTQTPTNTPTETTTPTPTPTRPLDNFTGRFTTTFTGTGSSNINQVKLPFISGTGTNYSCIVDWGDTNTDYVNVWSASSLTHTYSSPGTYTINIYADPGNLRGWSYNNSGDKLKIVEVLRWGPLQLGTGQTAHFYGCSNLVLTGVTDVINLSGTTKLTSTFNSCTSLTTINNVGSWDMSKVNDSSGMFASASNFDDDLGNWDMRNNQYLSSMFQDAVKFDNKGSNSINNWITSANTVFSYMFYSSSAGVAKFNRNIGSWDTSKSQQFNYMFHRQYLFNNNGSPSISGWTMSAATNLGHMFYQCSSFNQPVGSWDVKNVTDNSGFGGMMNLFGGCSSFDQDLSNWNVRNVVKMQSMFQASAFKNSGFTGIDNWVTSAVTNMSSMFASTPFNQPIGSWDVRNVVTMASMFQLTSQFNQDIGSWDVSKVQNMSGMFASAVNFNNGGSPSISAWTTTSLQSTASMFATASNFNQPIGYWNMSGVTSMSSMFSNAVKFNNSGDTSISAWTINSGVTNMGSLFSGAVKFNQPIENWNVSRVQIMSNMFQLANDFNQPLAGWDTYSVTNMTSMFSSASAFNQPIGNWNVSGVTNFTSFMANKTPSTFSATNLTDIYTGWTSGGKTVKTGLTISFGTAKYTADGQAGKDLLTGATPTGYGWTGITDGGQE